METYVIKYPGSGYVALDQASGGYPYRVTDWKRAEFWDSEEEANRYRGLIGFKGFTIAKLIVSIIDIVDAKT